MNGEERRGVIVGATALVGLLLISLINSVEIGGISLTGAAIKDSYFYENCLTKYGKDIYGDWQWEEIKNCREYYKAASKGKDKAIPVLTLQYRAGEIGEGVE